MSPAATRVTTPSATTSATTPPDSCPVRDVIDRVGDKWSVLLITQLTGGPLRFSALLRGTEGLSQRMLTRTLRLLERDGLVLRSVAPTTPPQVTYSLTPLGRSLARALDPLTQWAFDNRTAVQAARDAWEDEAHQHERTFGT